MKNKTTFWVIWLKRLHHTSGGLFVDELSENPRNNVIRPLRCYQVCIGSPPSGQLSWSTAQQCYPYSHLFFCFSVSLSIDPNKYVPHDPFVEFWPRLSTYWNSLAGNLCSLHTCAASVIVYRSIEIHTGVTTFSLLCLSSFSGLALT